MAVKKKQTSIVAKSVVNYNPDTFAEYKRDNFNEVTAEELLAKIKPMEFDFLPGRRFIAWDTETFATLFPANRMPSNVVRRFIKKHGSSDYIPNDFPFCISVCDGVNAFVVYDTLENQFKEFKKLEPLFMDMSIEKLGHNTGFDRHMIANARVNMRGKQHDTYFLVKTAAADRISYDLFGIAKDLEEGVTEFESMLKQYKTLHKINDYRKFPRELMTQYTCGDVWNTIYTFKEYYPKIVEQNQVPIYELENEMLIVSYAMERVGVKIDAEYEKELIPELEKEATDAENEIYKTAGYAFNINSGRQVAAALDKLGYGNLVSYNRDTGNPKLDKFEKERLDNLGVPLIKQINTFLNATKLLNTFARKLYEMRDANSVVHCNFNTSEAKTGRFSISAPSMQNMPRRKDSRVRGAFIAPEGYTLYDFDFKSQESIILAHYSKAERLLTLMKEGKDAHKATAMIVWHVPYDEVTKELRELSKSIGFAIVYGAGPDKVANMTGKTVYEARQAIAEYMDGLPEVDTFIKLANRVAKRRRYIATIMNKIVYVSPGQEYACVNYIIQGSAAVSTKTRMVDIYKYLKSNNFKTYMILQVHDSLLNCVHKDEEEFILGKLRWLQTERKLFDVEVKVDVAKCHPTWRNKNDVEVAEIPLTQEELDRMNAYDIWAETLF